MSLVQTTNRVSQSRFHCRTILREIDIGDQLIARGEHREMSTGSSVPPWRSSFTWTQHNGVGYPPVYGPAYGPPSPPHETIFICEWDHTQPSTLIVKQYTAVLHTVYSHGLPGPMYQRHCTSVTTSKVALPSRDTDDNVWIDAIRNEHPALAIMDIARIIFQYMDC